MNIFVLNYFQTTVYYTYVCNTLIPQIKGKCGATNLMFPFAPGQHHNVALEGGKFCLI